MIGIIFTGGTIGSTLGDKYISTDSGKEYKLLSMYKEKYGDSVEFITETPYEILSENMTCAEYPLLAKAVMAMLDRGVKGVIVTHGSDTLAYSAAFLSYVIPKGSAPVMLVASNYVLEDDRANGLYNFAAAVDFIKNCCGTGVFVPYRNRDGVVRVYYGNTLLPFDMGSDELRCHEGSVYGDYAEGCFVLSGKENPTPVMLYDIPDSELPHSGVLAIHPYPGMRYPSVDGYKAVLHYSYHSGTMCAAEKSFEDMVREASEKKIPIYYVDNHKESSYDSVRKLEELGIKKLCNISEVAAYIVVWLSENMKI